MKPGPYLQCVLERTAPTGTERRVSWLPSPFAIPGRVVRLRDARAGTWSDGWRVASCFGPPLAEAVVLRNSRDYLHQREASDI